MNLYISSSNSLNTDFVTEDNALWYSVETTGKIGDRTTTITRCQPKREVIGQILWKTFSQTLVRLGSVQLERKSFLRRKKFLSSHKYMTGSDGHVYEWKNTGTDPELWSTTSGRRVAHYVSKNIKGRERYLVIEPKAEPTMDVIIIAYIILDKRKKDTAAAGEITGAAGGAAGAAVGG